MLVVLGLIKKGSGFDLQRWCKIAHKQTHKQTNKYKYTHASIDHAHMHIKKCPDERNFIVVIKFCFIRYPKHKHLSDNAGDFLIHEERVWVRFLLHRDASVILLNSKSNIHTNHRSYEPKIAVGTIWAKVHLEIRARTRQTNE